LIELKKDFQLIAAAHADNVAKDTAPDQLLSMLGQSAAEEMLSSSPER